MPLHLTQQAADYIKTHPGHFLRVRIKSGGCSGLRTIFSLEPEGIDEKDTVSESYGARVVTDALSLSFIDNSVIDYKEELISSSFVLTNPKASSGCGCGESFSIA